MWRTSPVDCPPDSADFVNAVVRIDARCATSPGALLEVLKRMEARFGRGASPVRHAPRELDLDLLLFDDIVSDDADCRLPHPRAVDRRFVMVPAAEVAPEVTWPGVDRTIAEIAASLVTEETLTRIAPD